MNTLTAADLPDLATVPLHLTQIHVSYEQAVRLLKIRDTYDWHQRVWQAFGRRDGDTRDFLVRIDRMEEAFRVLILSRNLSVRPDWCPSDCFQTKLIPETFFGHSHYAFSLLANPTKKIRSNAEGERTKNGRRVPLTKRDDLLAWLERKAAASGFSFDPATVQTIPRGREYFHKNGAHGTHVAADFRGRLTVTDPGLFRTTVATGIGSAKAFGFGLLVLAPLS
jgi:CRISPR system Cascade subunit CasE